jgi:hypothetical protein
LEATNETGKKVMRRVYRSKLELLNLGTTPGTKRRHVRDQTTNQPSRVVALERDIANGHKVAERLSLSV